MVTTMTTVMLKLVAKMMMHDDNYNDNDCNDYNDGRDEDENERKKKRMMLKM